MIQAIQMRVGMIIRYKHSLCRVSSLFHQALSRKAGKVVAKLKNLETGSNVEVRFRSDEKVEPIRIEGHDISILRDTNIVLCGQTITSNCYCLIKW